MVTSARFQNLRRFKRVGLIGVAVIVIVPLLLIGVGRLSNHQSDGIRTSVSVPPAVNPAATAAPPRAAAGATVASGAAVSAPAATTAAGSAAAGSASSSSGARGTVSDAVGANIPIVPTGKDQLIIRTAAITLIVKDVGQTQAGIWRMSEELGGFVTNSNASGAGDAIRGQITIRVPTEQYGTAMDRLRAFAVKVDSEKSDAQDVSEEYVDLQARRQNLELTVQQLQGFLGQAKSVDEALRVQSQLNNVQSDLERIKGRMGYLTDRANYSTITTTLMPTIDTKAVPPVGTSSWSAGHSVHEAWDRSLRGLENIADAAIAITIGGWWLLLPLAIGTILLVRRTRQRPQALQPAAATLPVDHVSSPEA
jgi:hypothetical protein